MCGDSTNAETVRKLMQNEKADLHWIDPPYNLSFTGTTKGKFDKMSNDSLNDKQYDEFINKILENMEEHSAQHTSYYICIDFRKYPQWAEHLQKKKKDILNVIVWDKVYAGLGNKYRFRHEFIIYAGDRTFTKWYGDMVQEDVIKIQATQEQNQDFLMLDRKGYAIPLQNGSFLRLKIEDKIPKRIRILEGETQYFRSV